jgi:hypothetical protein
MSEILFERITVLYSIPKVKNGKKELSRDIKFQIKLLKNTANTKLPKRAHTEIFKIILYQHDDLYEIIKI